MANKVAVLTAGALALAGGAWYWSSAGDDDGGDEGSDETEVPQEQVLEFFAKLQKAVPEKMAPLMQQIAQIQGQPGVDKAQLMKVIAQQFDKCCLGAQAELLQELGVDEEDMSQATHVYMRKDDDDVLEAVNDFRSLYTLQYGGAVEVDLPKDLDEDKMCAAFDTYCAARDDADKTYMKELQKKQGQITPEQHMLLLKRANHLMGSALKKHGLSVFQFQSASAEFAETSTKFKAKHDKDEQEQEAKRQFLAQMGQR